MKIRHLWVFSGVIPFLVVSALTAVNIPVMDDYEMVLGSLIDWKKADFWDKLGVLFAQYNEHRIVFSRVMYVLYYSILGDVNFRNLIFLANAQLLVVASVGVYFIRKVKVDWQLYAFIWVLMVFDLNTYENGSIASYGMQNWSVLMWVFLAFYGYDKGGKWWILGCIAQFISVFCSGNGMLSGLFLILCFPKYRLVATIAFISSICLYFLYGYEFVHQPDQSFNVGVMSVYFLRVLGAPVSFEFSLCFGVCLSIFLIYKLNFAVIWKDKMWWPGLGILGFALASIAEAALFRSGLPNAQFQTSRYLILPQMVIGIMFCLMPLRLWWNRAGAIGIVLLMFWHNFEFGKMGFERTADRSRGYKYYHPNPTEAAKIAAEAANQNIYFLEDNR